MASRGMSADHERATKPHQFAGRRAHLAKDVVDGDGRAKVVSWNGDADPVRVQAARAMTEKRAVERLPVAAMDEDDDRPFAVTGKEIDRVALAGTIRERARNLPLAIGSGIACPARDQRGVFRHARPVVVLDLVVDIGHRPASPAGWRISAPSPWSWPATASTRGRPSASDPKICRRSRSRARRPSCETRRGRPWSAGSPGRGDRCPTCAGRDGLTRRAARPARSHCRSRPSSVSRLPTASCLRAPCRAGPSGRSAAA